MNAVNNESSFAQYIRSAVRFYLNLLQKAVDLLKHSWKLPLLVLILSLAYTAYRYFTYKTVFTARQTYVYNCLHKKVYGDWILALDQLLQQRQYNLLAAQLAIPKDAVLQLHSIKASNIAGSPLSDDITEAKLPFYVSCQYNSNGEAGQSVALQKAITSYLNHQPRAKMAMKKVIEGRLQRIAYLEKQLEILDTLKRNILPESAASSGTLTEVFALNDKYQQELIELRSQSPIVDAVEIFDTANPERSSAKDWLRAKGIPAVIALSLMVMLVNTFIYWYKHPSLD
ncbi:MAG: hypothetical protein JNM21_00880 [Taibaiella sp.]|nr:hypothetical protein [Taibaiella sp.]